MGVAFKLPPASLLQNFQFSKWPISNPKLPPPPRRPLRLPLLRKFPQKRPHLRPKPPLKPRLPPPRRPQPKRLQPQKPQRNKKDIFIKNFNPSSKKDIYRPYTIPQL